MEVYGANEHIWPKEPIARFVTPALRGTSGEGAGGRGIHKDFKTPPWFQKNFVVRPLVESR
jgi:hypothetical protein